MIIVEAAVAAEAMDIVPTIVGTGIDEITEIDVMTIVVMITTVMISAKMIKDGRIFTQYPLTIKIVSRRVVRIIVSPRLRARETRQGHRPREQPAATLMEFQLP